MVGAGSASAVTITVNQFEPNPVFPAVPVADTWYRNDVRTGGSVTIRDLTGLGGNLETNQPLPNGAARLTTNNTDVAKAEVSTWAIFEDSLSTSQGASGAHPRNRHSSISNRHRPGALVTTQKEKSRLLPA